MISDDCDTLYEDQPHCSEVVAEAARLGFEPATPLQCRPAPQMRSSHWTKTAWGCEIEVVFLARGVPMLPSLWRFHQLAHSGCIAYPDRQQVPNSSMIMLGPGKWANKDASGYITTMHSASRVDHTGDRFRNGLYACVPSG